MRVADFIARRLHFLGIEHALMVTGGAAMHLNDAISSVYKDRLVFLHHEQSCSMAADAYARLTNKPCLVNVTAGPGAINALNGVFGAFVDSLPMVVVSGQSKRQTLTVNSGLNHLRQLGDQEAHVQALASPVCKSVHLLQNPLDVNDIINQLFLVCTSGRPGPVWLDVPIDVQAYHLPGHYEQYIQQPLLEVTSNPDTPETLIKVYIDELAYHLLTDDRPVLYVGNGIRLSGSYSQFLDFLEQWPIACVTGWNSNDLLWDSHPCYCGRPGTVGNRTGNFAVQFSKSLLVVGCRLNIRQISYNWDSFSPDSWKCHVDIDPAELYKPTLSTDLKIQLDISNFFPLLSEALSRISYEKNIDLSKSLSHWSRWRAWLKSSLSRFSVVEEALPISNGHINPYRLISMLSNYLSENSITVCSDGTACVAGFQAVSIKRGQRIFHNSGCASMGFELPAAIGAHLATNQQIICLAGDGSIMMNLQVLAIIGGKKYPVKIILLNNKGYHSIRQTQTNYFPNNLVGCGPDSGLPFPNFNLLCQSCSIDYHTVCDEELIDAHFEHLFSTSSPQFLEVHIDQSQQFSPKLSSRRLPSGEMVSPSLDDMSPHLPQSLLSALKADAYSIVL